MGVIYKFTLVWYSAKQGTMLRPTSQLMHLYTVPFVWPQDEHRRQQNWVYDFAGQGWLWWLSSRTTFVAATHGLPTNLGVGRSWLFPASSVKFLTGSSLKSWRVYLVHMKITVSNCWVLLDPEGGKTISWSTWRYIDSSNNCWPYDQNCWHNPCAGCNIHDVRCHGVVAVITKISFCWWWGHCYSFSM